MNRIISEERQQFFDELTFREVANLLVDMMYGIEGKIVTDARDLKITYDMVNAEMTRRMYFEGV